jgi:hypothetical protein
MIKKAKVSLPQKAGSFREITENTIARVYVITDEEGVHLITITLTFDERAIIDDLPKDVELIRAGMAKGQPFLLLKRSVFISYNSYNYINNIVTRIRPDELDHARG